MKKTFVKKLVLSKATVANLSKSELNEVNGGYVTAWAICGHSQDCTVEYTGTCCQ